jgi:hypothetical protein
LDELGPDGNAAAGTLGGSSPSRRPPPNTGRAGAEGPAGSGAIAYEGAVGTVQQPCSNPSEYPETTRNVLQAKSLYLQGFCKLQKASILAAPTCRCSY